MNKTKAIKKDLKTKFSGTLNEVVNQEDPKPSRKVKKLIRKSSKKLAVAVIDDTKKAKKKALKAEKKAARAQKKSSKGEKTKKDKSSLRETEVVLG